MTLVFWRKRGRSHPEQAQINWKYSQFRLSSCSLSSSWVLLFPLSLAFFFCSSGCSSLFIYWLFSMKKHLVFDCWQQMGALSLALTVHWLSSLAVRFLAGVGALHCPESLRSLAALSVVVFLFLLRLAKSFVMYL